MGICGKQIKDLTIKNTYSLEIQISLSLQSKESYASENLARSRGDKKSVVEEICCNSSLDLMMLQRQILTVFYAPCFLSPYFSLTNLNEEPNCG